MTLGKDDVLVIEGIHGLNDKLSYSLPIESKFKIYISALTQLNIDEHNCLPTTDGRLIRRIVRDARTRGTSAKETIAMWDSVRRGEEKYIFPFQEGADVMFNSALIYELAVLKMYAEPLLFAIDKDCQEYLEAKRLLKFLDYFLPMPSDGINQNSILLIRRNPRPARRTHALLNLHDHPVFQPASQRSNGGSIFKNNHFPSKLIFVFRLCNG